MKLIRDKIPFVLLGISLIFTIFKYYEVYFAFYKYLGDLVGYSILTNIFMLSVYLNKRYCSATKVTVLGLIALNLFNIVYNAFGVNGVIYDFFIIFITLIIVIVYKFKI